MRAKVNSTEPYQTANMRTSLVAVLIWRQQQQQQPTPTNTTNPYHVIDNKNIYKHILLIVILLNYSFMHHKTTEIDTFVILLACIFTLYSLQYAYLAFAHLYHLYYCIVMQCCVCYSCIPLFDIHCFMIFICIYVT